MKHVKLYEEFFNESVSMDAVYIHQITNCGQDAAQNFIDDNNIDADKLVAYVKQHRNSKEKYDVRDMINGSNTNKRFIKQFIKEAKDSDTFVGNPGEDKRLVDIRAFRGSVKDLTDYVSDKAKESQVSEGTEIKTATNKHGEHFKIGDTIVAPDNKPVKIIGFQKGKDGHMKAQYNAGMFVDVYNLDDVEKV